jgi:hypothetical protein
MIRVFSIGQAVATIRPIIAVFFATGPLSGLTPYQFFGAGFGLALRCTSSRRRSGFDGLDHK